MPAEIVTIAGTLAAAVIAGVVSYIADRSMKTHEWKLVQVREEHASRKSTYVSFLADAQRLVIQASEEKMGSVAKLDRLSHLYAEITVVGGKPVTEAAMQVFDSALVAHVRDQDAADSTEFHSRKQAFLDAVRAELHSLSEA